MEFTITDEQFYSALDAARYLEGKIHFEIESDEIIRCKDCKYGFDTDDGYYLNCHGMLATTWDYCNDKPKMNIVEPYGFCAWGKRRNNANNI